jgi:hypothetical protein
MIQPSLWQPLNDSSRRVADLHLSASVGSGFEDRHSGARWASDHHAAPATGGREQFRTCFTLLVRDFDAPAPWTAARETNAAAIPDPQLAARWSDDEACGQRVTSATEDAQGWRGTIVICAESRHCLYAAERNRSIRAVQSEAVCSERARGRFRRALTSRRHHPGDEGDQANQQNERANALILLAKAGDVCFQSSDYITRVHVTLPYRGSLARDGLE